MKTRILMVYPENPTTYWSFKYSMKFIGKKANLPPLGLITVAALLPDDCETRLVDMNIERLDRADVLWADLVFVSAMIVQKKSFETVIDLCKELGRTVVAGGPYPTAQYAMIDGVDHFVLGEAELTLPLFLRDYKAGNPGHVYKSDARADITLTPAPRFDLLDMNRYAAMALQYSRGCPFNCEFCDIIEMFGRTPRVKTPEQFINEMETLYRDGFRGALFVVDDNFIGNAKHVKELLRRIIPWQAERGNPFKLFTEASINLAADDELLGLMAAAGFDMVFLGIETPSRESLLLIGKHQNLKGDLIGSVKKIQAAGMEVSAGFIVGFDTDGEDIFDRQIGFIRESAIPFAMVGLLTALPGTRLYRRLDAEKRLLQGSSGNNTHDFELNFVPVMEKEALIAGYRGVLAEIYRPENYFKRCLSMLRRFPGGKKAVRPVGPAEIRALFLSLLLQIFSRHGFQYLKFLARSVLVNPRLFPDAVTLAVKGYHLFRITDDMLAADSFRRYLQTNLGRAEAYMLEVYDAGGRALGSIAGLRDRIAMEAGKRYRRLNLEARSHAAEAMALFEKNLNATFDVNKQTE